MSSAAPYAVLFWGVWPLWLAAGIADWACHRRTHIEATSGTPEWVLHVIQAAQLGLAIALALATRITSLVLLILALLMLIHWLSGYVDTRYTYGRREIAPFEQSVHAVLELAPLFGVVLIGLAHPDAWAGRDWGIVFERPAMSVSQLVTFVVVTVALLLVPLVEEGLRCRKESSRAQDRASSIGGLR